MVKKYATALVDQFVASVFSFVLSIVLIRIWEPEAFGVFAFWQTTLLLVIGIQNAMVNTPLNIFIPASKTQGEVRQVEETLFTINLILVFAFVILSLATGSWLPGASSNAVSAGVITALFLGGGLVREYERSRCFGNQQPIGAFRINSAYTLIGSVALVIAFFEPDRLDLIMLFGILSVASIVSSFFGQSAARASSSTRLWPPKIDNYHPIWVQSKWALVGVITTNIQGRGYVYLISAAAGLEALAMIAAAEIVFRPIGLLVTAWARVSRPRLAVLASQSDFVEFHRIVRIALLGLFLSYGVLCGVVWLGWNLIDEYLYLERYNEMGSLVGGWALVVFIGSVRAIFSNSLQSLKRFKRLATATVFGSLSFLASALVILPIFGYRRILVCLAVAELVSLFYIYIEYRKFGPSKNRQFGTESKTWAT